MDHSVVWLLEAIDDVERIAAHIASDSRAYASALVQTILAAAGELSFAPERGRVVPEWDDDRIRETFIGSYRLIYHVEGRRVTVLTLVHGARQL